MPDRILRLSRGLDERTPRRFEAGQDGLPRHDGKNNIIIASRGLAVVWRALHISPGGSVREAPHTTCIRREELRYEYNRRAVTRQIQGVAS